MADLIERASAINALQYVLDSPNYSKALGEMLRIPTADTPQTEDESEPYICDTCKYSDKEWYEEPCECCHNNSGYKPKDTPQTVQKIAEFQKMCGIEIDPDRIKTDCGWK